MSVWTGWTARLQALAARSQREAAGAGRRPHRWGLDLHSAASRVTLVLQGSSWLCGDFFLGACPWCSWASRVWPAQGLWDHGVRGHWFPSPLGGQATEPPWSRAMQGSGPPWGAHPGGCRWYAHPQFTYALLLPRHSQALTPSWGRHTGYLSREQFA